MGVQRWMPQGSTMIAVPGGKFVLASDVVGVDAEREIAELQRRLALAVAEVRAWRQADGEHDWTGETNGPQHMITSVMFARGATDADPELAKMIGGGE
jgi:hypothetical protein